MGAHSKISPLRSDSFFSLFFSFLFFCKFMLNGIFSKNTPEIVLAAAATVINAVPQISIRGNEGAPQINLVLVNTQHRMHNAAATSHFLIFQPKKTI